MRQCILSREVISDLFEYKVEGVPETMHDIQGYEKHQRSSKLMTALTLTGRLSLIRDKLTGPREITRF